MKLSNVKLWSHISRLSPVRASVVIWSPTSFDRRQPSRAAAAAVVSHRSAAAPGVSAAAPITSAQCKRLTAWADGGRHNHCRAARATSNYAHSLRAWATSTNVWSLARTACLALPTAQQPTDEQTDARKQLLQQHQPKPTYPMVFVPGTPNFWDVRKLSGDFFLSENFRPKMQNLGLKKNSFWENTVFATVCRNSVGNL